MPKKKPAKIVLTGGHAATTALSVVEELIRDRGWSIYWIGSEVAVEGKNIPTLESKVFPQIGVTAYGLTAGRVQRRFTRWTILSLLKIPLGFLQAFFFLLKIRPKVILSFGGYAGFPVVVSGWLLGIPVVIHEQTCAAGRANQASALFAKKIALAREESKNFFPKEKCVVVGNPIMTQIGEIKPKDEPSHLPVIFITCGSRGAQRINNIIEKLLPHILLKYKVTHLTGLFDFEKFKKIQERLPGISQERYAVYPWVDPMALDNLYRESDLIIARSGANTVAEVLSVRRPAILIPIPWTYLDEQVKNAEFAKKYGIAKVIAEDVLTPEKLLGQIEDSFKNWKEIVRKAGVSPTEKQLEG